MRKLVVIALAPIGVLVVLIYVSVSETEDGFRTCEVHDFDDLKNIDF